jgi:hypothetical protein
MRPLSSASPSAWDYRPIKRDVSTADGSGEHRGSGHG